MTVVKDVAKQSIIRLLGPDRGAGAVARIGNLVSSVEYVISSDGRRSRRLLKSMRDLHRGQQCWILGNGPSLLSMDLQPLRTKVTFGLNRAYLMFDRLGFTTTYLVAVNRLVIEQCASDFESLTLPRFVAWHSRRLVRNRSDFVFLRTHGIPGFARDPRRGLWEGGTVTYVALQLAYYMGFGEVVLVGVDHSFTTTGPANKEIVSTGDDPNHFDPAYFGRGFRWNLPDLELSEVGYSMARDAFVADGRRVIDATVGGKLQVFPKGNYADLL